MKVFKGKLCEGFKIASVEPAQDTEGPPYVSVNGTGGLRWIEVSHAFFTCRPAVKAGDMLVVSYPGGVLSFASAADWAAHATDVEG